MAEVQSSRVGRRLSAILAADVAGYFSLREINSGHIGDGDRQGLTANNVSSALYPARYRRIL
jgi:hypothetical protein